MLSIAKDIWKHFAVRSDYESQALQVSWLWKLRICSFEPIREKDFLTILLIGLKEASCSDASRESVAFSNEKYLYK